MPKAEKPTKRCHAPGCDTPIERRYLMCRKHWNMVTPSVQAEVYATVGALRGRGDLRAYVLATTRAQLDVAICEGMNEQIAGYLRKEIARHEAGIATDH